MSTTASPSGHSYGFPDAPSDRMTLPVVLDADGLCAEACRGTGLDPSLGEIVDVAVRLTAYRGRYLVHCPGKADHHDAILVACVRR